MMGGDSLILCNQDSGKAIRVSVLHLHIFSLSGAAGSEDGPSLWSLAPDLSSITQRDLVADFNRTSCPRGVQTSKYRRGDRD
jgi:hypothetical protein